MKVLIVVAVFSLVSLWRMYWLRRAHQDIVTPLLPMGTKTVLPPVNPDKPLINLINSNTMADITVQLTVTITDASGGKITIPLPVIDTGAAITSALTTAENVVKPFFNIIEAL